MYNLCSTVSVGCIVIIISIELYFDLKNWNIDLQTNSIIYREFVVLVWTLCLCEIHIVVSSYVHNKFSKFSTNCWDFNFFNQNNFSYWNSYFFRSDQKMMFLILTRCRSWRPSFSTNLPFPTFISTEKFRHQVGASSWNTRMLLA